MHKPLLTNKYELRFFGFLGIILLICLIVSIVLSQRIQREGVSSPTKIVKYNPYEDLVLTAKAVHVYDARTKEVLFEKNSKARLPLASVTKVMTAVVASDLAPNHSLVTITEEAIMTDGDSGLFAGERWRLRNLLDFLLTSSSNDGARAVALTLGALNITNPTTETSEKDFINLMNKKANQLGMKNTYFFNETGLDESENKGGAYGSAEDMSKLFTYILKNQPGLLDATTHKIITISSMDNFSHVARNTDQIVNNIPGIKGSKTGFTDIAGGNLVIAFDPELGRPIIVSVLGSTAEERFNDVTKLIQATLIKVSEE